MQKDDRESAKRVKEKLNEELAVEEAHAVVYPRTVVVHVQDAEAARTLHPSDADWQTDRRGEDKRLKAGLLLPAAADRAVVRAVGFPYIADFAVAAALVVISHIKAPVSRDVAGVGGGCLAKGDEEAREGRVKSNAEAHREEAKVRRNQREKQHRDVNHVDEKDQNEDGKQKAASSSVLPHSHRRTRRRRTRQRSRESPVRRRAPRGQRTLRVHPSNFAPDNSALSSPFAESGSLSALPRPAPPQSSSGGSSASNPLNRVGFKQGQHQRGHSPAKCGHGPAAGLHAVGRKNSSARCHRLPNFRSTILCLQTAGQSLFQPSGVQ